MRRSHVFVWCVLVIASSAGCGEEPGPSAVLDAPIADATDGRSAPVDVAPDASSPNDDAPPALDASRDVAADLAADVAPSVDVPRDAAPADVAPVDAPRDVAPADALRDVAPADAPRDAAPADAPLDAAPADAPRDAAPADVSTCSGAAPAVGVTAPMASEAIETCTASGMPVFYAFTATVTSSASLRSVTAEWRTPRGDLAPPPPPPQTAAPFVFRRQVGGMMVDVPSLAVLGDALRGTWQFEVTAVDVCGRTTTTRQPFTLMFTSRRCPNP